MTAAIPPLELTCWLLACAACVLLSAFFSGAETGMYCLNRMRLRLAAHEKQHAATRLQRLLSDQAGLLFTTLVGTNAANYLAPICLVTVFLHFLQSAESEHLRAVYEHKAELLTTLILTPILFIFGEIVPKNVFQRQADRYMMLIATPLSAAYQAARVTGLLVLQRQISRFLRSRLGRQTASTSALHPKLEMYQMLREGAADGALTTAQMFILQRIPTLKALRIANVMTPRSSSVMLNAIASRREILDTIRHSPYSRLPVYRGERANVIGIVHILDVLTAPADSSLTQCLQPLLTLNYTTPVMKALTALQRGGQRMAVVVDRSGRCLGLVTIKDLVEEIVGELAAW
jgi:putative hemolysin